MRRIIRSLAGRLMVILASVCTLVLVAPGNAAAGGPTSVLLASPDTDSAAALYYADADYNRLQSLLGGPDLPAGPVGTPPASAAGSPYVTATWLIHDVSVWRIDRIFLIGDDVWVVSEASADGAAPTGDGMYPGETGNPTAVWHRPTDPAALTALLTGHGLTPGGPHPAAAVSPAATPVPQADVRPSAAGRLWGIGGLVVGLVIGSVLARLAAGRPNPAGPAQPARMVPLA